MAITNGYATLAEVKARLNIDTDVTTWDAVLEGQVEAVSRAIDAITGRRFYAASETRYFTPENVRRVYVDDLLSVTTFKSDPDGDLDYDYTWDSDDYLLMPANASADGEPYTWVEVHPNGDYYMPVWASGTPIVRSIEIEGSFGYASSTPSRIAEACILGTQQVYKRKDAIFGVMGSEGYLSRLRYLMEADSLIMSMLSGYQRIT